MGDGGKHQVGSGASSTPHALLLFVQLTERDEKLAIPLALVRRKREDAGEVVVFGRRLLLREVADDVGATLVDLREDVEQEGLDVVVQRLVVQKQLGEEAQVLAVYGVVLAVHFKDGEGAVPVHLIPWRVPELALALVPLQRLRSLHVLQAKLANEQLVL
jgi:hypothetical protein